MSERELEREVCDGAVYVMDGAGKCYKCGRFFSDISDTHAIENHAPLAAPARGERHYRVSYQVGVVEHHDSYISGEQLLALLCGHAGMTITVTELVQVEGVRGEPSDSERTLQAAWDIIGPWVGHQSGCTFGRDTPDGEFCSCGLGEAKARLRKLKAGAAMRASEPENTASPRSGGFGISFGPEG